MIWALIAVAVLGWGLTVWAGILRAQKEWRRADAENMDKLMYRAWLDQLTDASGELLHHAGWADEGKLSVVGDVGSKDELTASVLSGHVGRVAHLVRALRRERERRGEEDVGA